MGTHKQSRKIESIKQRKYSQKLALFVCALSESISDCYHEIEKHDCKLKIFVGGVVDQSKRESPTVAFARGDIKSLIHKTSYSLALKLYTGFSILKISTVGSMYLMISSAGLYAIGASSMVSEDTEVVKIPSIE